MSKSVTVTLAETRAQSPPGSQQSSSSLYALDSLPSRHHCAACFPYIVAMPKPDAAAWAEWPLIPLPRAWPN